MSEMIVDFSCKQRVIRNQGKIMMMPNTNIQPIEWPNQEGLKLSWCSKEVKQVLAKLQFKLEVLKIPRKLVTTQLMQLVGQDHLCVDFPRKQRSNRNRSVRFADTHELVIIEWPTKEETKLRWYSEEDKAIFKFQLKFEVYTMRRKLATTPM